MISSALSPDPVPGDATKPLVEVGFVLAGPLDRADVRAIHQARTALLERLRTLLPGFEWRMPVITRREVAASGHAEPVSLLDLGVQERDVQSWDFAFVVTQARLQSYFKPFTLATPSRSTSAAVLSTARLDPAALDVTDEEQRVDTMARRLVALALHLFGHLNDLDHSEDAADVMYDLRTVTDLDGMQHLSSEATETLREALHDVADLRLEEQGTYRGRTALFYLRATLQNLRSIVAAVLDVRPWRFPFHFSRLTTAAASTLLILIMTAEAWDLGMTQPPWVIVALSLAALLGTSLYIIKRQHLLVRRRHRHLREQHVIGNVAVVATIVLGMATTYGLLFIASLLLSTTLYSTHLVAGWAAALDGRLAAQHYLLLAGFIASVGLIIGALGASFEDQNYFRHVAFVDEET